MPACVTPERLMALVRSRNETLDPRFAEVARWYKHYGEAWRVRWDYAFFQMVVETNALRFRRGDGSRGDVRPEQNNFAGIGTTGGGVRGDAFADVKTGVLGHIQHLVAYSGERLAAPVAPRTRLTQDDIVSVSVRLGRPVRFSDLARRWAVDRRYGQSIETIAEIFRKAHCTGGEPEQVAAAPVPKGAVVAAKRAAAPSKSVHGKPSALGGEPKLVARPAPAPAPASLVTATAAAGGRTAKASPPVRTVNRATETAALPSAAAASGTTATVAAHGAPSGCSVTTASYGGSKTLLIRSETPGTVRYVALGVLDGFERPMADGYIAGKAPGGSVLASFDTREAALARARALCPGG